MFKKAIGHAIQIDNVPVSTSGHSDNQQIRLANGQNTINHEMPPIYRFAISRSILISSASLLSPNFSGSIVFFFDFDIDSEGPTVTFLDGFLL